MESKVLSMVVVLCSLAWQISAQNASKAYPYIPPQKSCPICNTLNTGFTVSQAEITRITSAIASALIMVPPCQQTASSDVEVVVSRLSSTVNDETEGVLCPPNYIVINCRCSAESGVCDGVLLFSNGRGCQVRNGHAGGGRVRAIGTCVPNNGKFMVTTPSVIGANPVIACPATTRMIDCLLENMSGEQIQSATVISNNVCSVSTACMNSNTLGCRVMAVCERLV